MMQKNRQLELILEKVSEGKGSCEWYLPISINTLTSLCTKHIVCEKNGIYTIVRKDMW